MSEEELAKIAREYLKKAATLDEDRAFEWLIALYPEYVDQILDYLEDVIYDIHKNYYRG